MGFLAPYLTLMTEDTPQREHSLREVFNGLRWGAALPKWKRRMAARRRKTLVVCRACNELIQYGNYDGKTSQRT